VNWRGAPLTLEWISDAGTPGAYEDVLGPGFIDTECEKGWWKNLDVETLHSWPDEWTEKRMGRPLDPQPYSLDASFWREFLEELAEQSRPKHVLLSAEGRYFWSPVSEAAIFHKDVRGFILDLCRIFAFDRRRCPTSSIFLVEDPWAEFQSILSRDIPEFLIRSGGTVDYWVDVWPNAARRLDEFRATLTEDRLRRWFDLPLAQLEVIVASIRSTDEFIVEPVSGGILAFTEPFASIFPFLEALVLELSQGH